MAGNNFKIVRQRSSGQGSKTKSDKVELNRHASAKKKQSATHKHVPHCHKPAHLVAKRNARERRRVEAVNQAFGRLRKSIPNETNKTRRLSKVKILQKAMDYIKGLHNMLMTSELSLQSANNHKMQEQ